MKKCLAIFFILIVLILQGCTTRNNEENIVQNPEENESEKPNIDDEKEEEVIIPTPKPVYEWQQVNILHNKFIIGGIKQTIVDKDVEKQFTAIVDRQIDMLAEELVSRIEYIYGDNNINTTHNIKDTTDNTVFTNYNSMNTFSNTITKNMSVYNYKDEYVINDGTIMLDIEGNKVLYDSSKHNYYVIEDGIKYASVTSLNVGGLFTSPTAFQYTVQEIGRPAFDMSYPDGHHLDSIITLSEAIYGTPTWEYKETYIPYLAYESKYNIDSLTTPWNWANDFVNGAVKDKVKLYLDYIISNDIRDFKELPDEGVILSSDYDTMLTKISKINNYVSTYQDVIFDILTKIMIGDAYLGDLGAGEDGSYISLAIDLAIRKMNRNVATGYYYNGLYRSLYESVVSTDTMRIINRESNMNITNELYYNARNYKAYDVILKGILRQISNNDAYKKCSSISYNLEDIESYKEYLTIGNSSDIYLFFNGDYNLSNYRIYLDMDDSITVSNKNGEVLNYSKGYDDESYIIIDYIIKKSDSVPISLDGVNGYGADTTIEELLDDYEYIKISISNVDSFKLDIKELVEVK